MESVILLLGGNLGERERLMTEAKELLDATEGLRVVAESRMLESEPWGFGDMVVPPFLNQALELECELTPEALLERTQTIEQVLGRERNKGTREGEREGARAEQKRCYASRTMDIDIIYYGDWELVSERLKIPHPLVQERKFALEPIVEIAGERLHPTLRVSNRELLRGVARYK